MPRLKDEVVIGGARNVLLQKVGMRRLQQFAIQKSAGVRGEVQKSGCQISFMAGGGSTGGEVPEIVSVTFG